MRRIELKAERVWPYVLPFPLEVEKRRLIWSILQSRVGMSILTRIGVDQRTYQQDLIRETPYSNKSVIEYLKRMVSAGMLEHGTERVAIHGKRVWVKWCSPTQLGKWFILFLKHPGEVPPKLARETIEELFRLYSSSVVDVCEKYGLSIDSFHQILDWQHLREAVEKAPETEPSVVVFGSSAMDVHGAVERLPESEEHMYVEEIGRYPGGMGANVAIALARLGVQAAFSGKIGSDSPGRRLLESLREGHVDISNIIVGAPRSLQTLILVDKDGGRHLLTLGSPSAAISIASPGEVNWELVKRTRIVYIGEVFVEVASSIASFARTHGKTVIYRPGIPYLRFGVERVHGVLEHADIFMLNSVGWRILRESSKERIETMADLLKYGPSAVILTRGPYGCEVHTRDERFAMPVPDSLRNRFKVVHPTGAGDGLTAGVIKRLLEGRDLREAVSYGQLVAIMTCSRLGAAPAFPTAEEVEDALKNEKLG